MAGLINNTDTTVWILISGHVSNLNPGGQIGGIHDAPGDVDGYWYNGTFYGIGDNWFGGVTWYQVSGGDNGSVCTPASRGYNGTYPPDSFATLTKGSPSNSYTADNPFD
jgi:hypothetical protein